MAVKRHCNVECVRWNEFSKYAVGHRARVECEAEERIIVGPVELLSGASGAPDRSK